MMLSAPPGEAVSRSTHERTIEVTNTSILRHNRQAGWTLFAIDANDEHGNPITESLRSFQKIAPGTRRCTFEDYKGEAWTLREIDPVGVVRARRNEARAKLVGDANTPAAPVTSLDLAEVESRLNALEGRLELLASLLGADA